MVNKVAVIAIVAILTVPILIGFGMNLEPTTKTEYLPDQNPVIVSQLLQNGTAYTYTHADPYKLNTDFVIYDGNESSILPMFNEITKNSSSFSADYKKYTNQWWNGGARQNFNPDFTIFYEEFDYDYTLGHTNIELHYVDDNNVDSVVGTVSYTHSIYYDGVNQHYEATSYNLDGTYSTSSGDTPITYFLIDQMTGTARATVHRYIQYPTCTNFVNFSKGYYFITTNADGDVFSINLPERTSSAIMTMNLDSITTNSFNMSIQIPGVSGSFSIKKSTSSGVVSWEIRKGSEHIPLYYDPSRSDNTYQIKFDFRFVKTYTPISGPDQKQYDLNVEFRYVGGWPITIGEANYYQKYNLDYTLTRNVSDPEEYMDRIDLAYPLISTGRTPTIRMDDAYFAGFEYPAIRDNLYDPASFKTNPSTTMKNITLYGDSIVFGGQTFSVGSDGNIMLGTHKVSLNGIVFDSVPVTGGYDNRINGNVISTTATPSTIKLQGAWNANISTDSQSVNTYQTTVWHAGEFAWDGMDTNFLIVGLITSLAVFVGLGIYARKSNSKGVIPLMIVCGCAAVLFFIML